MLSDPGRNRWVAILMSMGMSEDRLSGKQGSCPVCGGKDRWRFDNKEGRGTWYCNQCGAGDGYKLVMMLRKVNFVDAKAWVASMFGDAPTEKPKPPKDYRPILNKLWTASRFDGHKISDYLKERSIDLPHRRWIEDMIRYHERCPWSDGAMKGFAPALVTRVYQDGKPVTLHRTFLDTSVPVRKMLMPHNGKLNGCYVPLGGMPKDVVGVAEGIETALSAAHIYGYSHPVWAALSASQLERFKPPEGVAEVIIYADNDGTYTGQAAAYKLANRLVVRNKIEATVIVPEKKGYDFNDILAEERRTDL